MASVGSGRVLADWAIHNPTATTATTTVTLATTNRVTPEAHRRTRRPHVGQNAAPAGTAAVEQVLQAVEIVGMAGRSCGYRAAARSPLSRARPSIHSPGNTLLRYTPSSGEGVSSYRP